MQFVPAGLRIAFPRVVTGDGLTFLRVSETFFLFSGRNRLVIAYCVGPCHFFEPAAIASHHAKVKIQRENELVLTVLAVWR